MWHDFTLRSPQVCQKEREREVVAHLNSSDFEDDPATPSNTAISFGSSSFTSSSLFGMENDSRPNTNKLAALIIGIWCLLGSLSLYTYASESYPSELNCFSEQYSVNNIDPIYYNIGQKSKGDRLAPAQQFHTFKTFNHRQV